jgi:hypothetical protein
MIPEAREVHSSRKDRTVLEACCRSPLTSRRYFKRARLFTACADERIYCTDDHAVVIVEDVEALLELWRSGGEAGEW